MKEWNILVTISMVFQICISLRFEEWNIGNIRGFHPPASPEVCGRDTVPIKGSWAILSGQGLVRDAIPGTFCLNLTQGSLSPPLVGSSSSVWYGHCPLIGAAGPDTCSKLLEVMEPGTLHVYHHMSGTSRE